MKTTFAGPHNPELLAATSAALATLLPVAAYQFGILDHLPDPEGNLFASDEITGSKMAHPFGVPDSVLGMASYGVTLALALLAPGRPRARKFLAFKLAGDGALASFNLVRQVVVFRKLCSWCTATSLCTVAMLIAGRALLRREARGLPAHSPGSSA